MATPPVLVTGSSGFIGRHLVDHLHALGHRVTALDLVEPRRPLPDGVHFLQCDLRESALPRGSFEVIVHLAALAGVRPSIERAIDYELTNVLGTLRLLDHCRCELVP